MVASATVEQEVLVSFLWLDIMIFSAAVTKCMDLCKVVGSRLAPYHIVLEHNW